ncbi:hypothetical protein Vretimale_13903, partial [Volvox reticuliferus]
AAPAAAAAAAASRSRASDIATAQQPQQHSSALTSPPPLPLPLPAPLEAEESKHACGDYFVHIGTVGNMVTGAQFTHLDTVAVPPDVIPYDEDMSMMLVEGTMPWMIAE